MLFAQLETLKEPMIAFGIEKHRYYKEEVCPLDRRTCRYEGQSRVGTLILL